MTGYAGDDEATAATLDSEGWLKTGDLCYFDSDGYLYIVDRLKELIKYKGYQVIDHLHLQNIWVTMSQEWSVFHSQLVFFTFNLTNNEKHFRLLQLSWNKFSCQFLMLPMQQSSRKIEL